MSSWNRELEKRFQETAQPLPVAQEYAEQTERDRSHLFRLSSGVALPLAQAFTTAVIMAGAVGVYCWLLKVPGDWWKYSLGTLAGVLVVFWLFLLSKWLRLVEPIERLLGVDLNGDGSVGVPEPEPRRLKIELKHDERRTQFIDLPYSERLPDFFRSIENGTPLSESAWCGAGALFSKREFYSLRDACLKAGIMRWKNEQAPAQGLELTPSGRAVMRYVAHLPTEDD